MNYLVWLFLLGYSTLSMSHSTDNGSKCKNIIILAGQSNMAGRAGLIYSKLDGSSKWDENVPKESQPNPQILRLNKDLKWELAAEPLHRDIDPRTSGVGPGMAFANSVLERNTDIGVIGLVPCAIGGTTIDQWGRGGELYDQMVNRTKAALQNGGGRIRAMLWYQGEADSNTLKTAESYKSKLEQFFTDVRSDLSFPKLPIIQVALASGGECKDMIRKVQLEMTLPNVKCVDADGLEISGDKLHLDIKGEIKLGRMLAGAFLQI